MAKLTKSLGKICKVRVISVNAVFLTSIFWRRVTNFWQVQNALPPKKNISAFISTNNPNSRPSGQKRTVVKQSFKVFRRKVWAHLSNIVRDAPKVVNMNGVFLLNAMFWRLFAWKSRLHKFLMKNGYKNMVEISNCPRLQFPKRLKIYKIGQTAAM